MIVSRKQYDEPYHPSKQTVEFFVWQTSLFKEENQPAPAHFQMIDHIHSKGKYKLVECSRGLAKSTLVGIYAVLYWAWKGYKPGLGDIEYILYIMESVANVASAIEQMAMIISDTPVLAQTLEVEKVRLGDDPTLYLYNKEKNKRFFIKGRGSGQSIRGTRIGGFRPNVVILDDIETEKTIATKDTREKLKNWFYAAVMPSVNPNRHEFIMIGTPLHEDSILINALEGEKWKAIQLPMAEEFPCENDKLVSAWPDRFTWEYINESYQLYEEQGKKTLWYQEHMLEIAPSEGLVFNMDKINHYKRNEMREKLGNLTYYIACDLAISEKEYADYTSIVVVGVEPQTGDWFLVDGEYGRWSVNDTIDKTFGYVRRYRPYSVVFESVAFQMAMGQILQNEMIRRGIFFNLQMVKRPGTLHKISVIKALQPIVELGKLWFPEDYAQNFVKELTHELSLATQEKLRSKHDDLADSLAMLTLIDIVAAQPVAEDSILSEDEEYINPYIF